MKVPQGAEEVAVTVTDEGAAFGAFRSNDGVVHIVGYHCGPSGDVLFAIHPDGRVEANPTGQEEE